MSKLQTIDISDNSLTSLPNGLLKGLTVLEDFGSWGVNKLSQLPSDVFSGLTALETLRFGLEQAQPIALRGFFWAHIFEDFGFGATTRLSQLPSEVFSGLTALEALDFG